MATMHSRSAKVHLSRGKKALRHFLRRVVEEVGGSYPEAVGWVSFSLLRLTLPASLSGSLGFRVLSEEMLESALATGNHEFRLNNAGFKLFLKISTRGKVTARVGGDQAKCYPEAAKMLTNILKEEGLEDDK